MNNKKKTSLTYFREDTWLPPIPLVVMMTSTKFVVSCSGRVAYQVILQNSFKHVVLSFESLYRKERIFKEIEKKNKRVNIVKISQY